MWVNSRLWFWALLCADLVLMRQHWKWKSVCPTVKGIWKIFNFLMKIPKSSFITYVNKTLCWHSVAMVTSLLLGRLLLLLHKQHFQLYVLRAFFSSSYLHKICKNLVLKSSVLREQNKRNIPGFMAVPIVTLLAGSSYKSTIAWALQGTCVTEKAQCVENLVKSK